MEYEVELPGVTDTLDAEAEVEGGQEKTRVARVWDKIRRTGI